MMFSDNAFTIRNTLKTLGIDRKKLLTTKQILILLLYSFVTINCVIATKNNWANINYRFTAINNLNVLITLFIIYIDYSIFNHKSHGLKFIVESGLYQYDEWMLSGHGKYITNKYKDDIRNINKFIYYLCITAVIFFPLAPLFVTIYFVKSSNKNGEKIYFDNLTLPYKSLHYPPQYDIMTVYIVNFIFQTIFTFAVLLITGCCAFIVAFDTTHLLAKEIELLCSNLSRMNEIVSDSKFSQGNCLTDYNKENAAIKVTVTQLDRLKIFMRCIITHHSIIMRKIKTIESGLQITMSAFSHGLVVQLCLGIYAFVQIDSIFLKIENFAASLTVLLNLFISYNKAQRITDLGEELRMRIFHCDWADKPQWFKKYILLMATCSNKELKINPFGIYVMNRTSFSKIINMSYSYFNLMNSMKK